MELKKCKCGGEAIYCGGWMIDQYKCSKCDYKTRPYFDGDEYAVYEWNNQKPLWGSKK